MNLSQQSSHLVLGTTTTLPAPAGIPAEAPLLSEKEVQVSAQCSRKEFTSLIGVPDGFIHMIRLTSSVSALSYIPNSQVSRNH